MVHAILKKFKGLGYLIKLLQIGAFCLRTDWSGRLVLTKMEKPPRNLRSQAIVNTLSHC